MYRRRSSELVEQRERVKGEARGGAWWCDEAGISKEKGKLVRSMQQNNSRVVWVGEISLKGVVSRKSIGTMQHWGDDA